MATVIGTHSWLNRRRLGVMADFLNRVSLLVAIVALASVIVAACFSVSVFAQRTKQGDEVLWNLTERVQDQTQRLSTVERSQTELRVEIASRLATLEALTQENSQKIRDIGMMMILLVGAVMGMLVETMIRLVTARLHKKAESA